MKSKATARCLGCSCEVAFLCTHPQDFNFLRVVRLKKIDGRNSDVLTLRWADSQ